MALSLVSQKNLSSFSKGTLVSSHNHTRQDNKQTELFLYLCCCYFFFSLSYQTMSSWPSLSLPNPFKSQGEEDNHNRTPSPVPETQENSSHGVKEDLSELTQTITRQLWGVASFLAPSPVSTSNSLDSNSLSQTLVGIRNDFAEFGGSFKTGLSHLSTLLQFQPDGAGADGGSALVGVSEEVLEFSRDISARPESWLDFPLMLSEDFDMSDSQREHALTVERLTPSLAALRIRLCSSHISEGYFWKIYFLLLQPILNEHDSKLLVSPEIVNARSIMRHQLQNKTNRQVQRSEVDCCSLVSSKGIIIQGDSNGVQEKGVLAETVTAARQLNADETEKIHQRLEEDGETVTSANAKKQHGNEEDVSFSDIEIDDDEFNRHVSSMSVQNSAQVSSSACNEWVQLSQECEAHGGENKATNSSSQKKNQDADESSDWFTIDDFDLDIAETL